MFIDSLWRFPISGSRQCAGSLVRDHSAMILYKHRCLFQGLFFIWVGSIYLFRLFIVWTFIFACLGGITTMIYSKTLWGERALFCCARGWVRDRAEFLSLRLTSVACRTIFCALSLASELQYFGGPVHIFGAQFIFSERSFQISGGVPSSLW